MRFLTKASVIVIVRVSALVEQESCFEQVLRVDPNLMEHSELTSSPPFSTTFTSYSSLDRITISTNRFATSSGEGVDGVQISFCYDRLMPSFKE